MNKSPPPAPSVSPALRATAVIRVPLELVFEALNLPGNPGGALLRLSVEIITTTEQRPDPPPSQEENNDGGPTPDCGATGRSAETGGDDFERDWLDYSGECG